jgi:alpha-1,6-mannosyltransferase
MRPSSMRSAMTVSISPSRASAARDIRVGSGRHRIIVAHRLCLTGRMRLHEGLRRRWRVVRRRYLPQLGTGSPVVRHNPSVAAARQHRAVVRRRADAACRAGFAGTAVLAVVTLVPQLPAAAVLTIGLAAMVTLVGAWLALGTVVRTLPVPWLYAVAAAWAVPLALGRPLFSGDVWSYLAQGLITATTREPYQLGPGRVFDAESSITLHVSHYWLHTPAPYGPAWETLSGGLARVGGSNLVASVIVYRVLAVLGVVLIAWALPRLARRVGAPPAAAVWLGVLNPLVLWHLVSGAHNDAVMIGLALAGLEVGLAGLAARGASRAWRIGAGFAMLVLAANVKVVAAGAVCCLAVHVARRLGRLALVASGVAVCAFALTTAITLLSGLGFGWVAALSSSSSVPSWMAPTNQLGALITGVGALFGADLGVAGFRIGMALGAAVGAVLAARVLWLVYRERTELVRGLGLLFAIMLVCGPVVQPWYVLWAVLPLAASARLPKQRLRLAVASAVVALALPPIGAGAGMLVSGYAGAAVLVTAGWWWLHRRSSTTRTVGDSVASCLRRESAITQPSTVADVLDRPGT